MQRFILATTLLWFCGGWAGFGPEAAEPQQDNTLDAQWEGIRLVEYGDYAAASSFSGSGQESAYRG